MGLVEGKVAFVTGVARGQGRSHAVRLAEEGADIIGIDICADIASVPYPMATPADLEETVQLIEKMDRRALLRQGDVRNFAEVRETVAAGLAQFGHIDIVCANAGIAQMGVGQTEEEVMAAWNDIIGVNLTGVWNTVRACAPSMMERNQGGSIILTSSTAGLKALAASGTIGGEGYGAAKHGVVGLMRHFAVELAGSSIRVNSVHPTGVNTKMVNNDVMAQFLASIPAGSEAIAMPANLLPVAILEPRDISDAVVFLASDNAKYITGVTLPVDAGFTIK
jgi:SDR family mycofactocin-dependent oxidoreductase